MMPATPRSSSIPQAAATSPNARCRVRSGMICRSRASSSASISAAVPTYRSETIFGRPPTRAISRKYQYVLPLIFFGYRLAINLGHTPEQPRRQAPNPRATRRNASASASHWASDNHDHRKLRLAEDPWLVDQPAPGAVGLAACDLDGGAAGDAGRGERQVAVDDRWLRGALEAGIGGEQLLVDLADRLGSGGELSGREGEHGVGLVEGDQALHVARVRPLDEEATEVLGTGRRLVCRVAGHRLGIPPVARGAPEPRAGAVSLRHAGTRGRRPHAEGRGDVVIVVTGATGHVGAEVVPLLVERDVPVRVVTRRQPVA